jgi:hypothetical protein
MVFDFMNQTKATVSSIVREMESMTSTMGRFASYVMKKRPSFRSLFHNTRYDSDYE